MGASHDNHMFGGADIARFGSVPRTSIDGPTIYPKYGAGQNKSMECGGQLLVRYIVPTSTAHDNVTDSQSKATYEYTSVATTPLAH